MAFWKILSLIVLVFVVYGSARQKEPRNRVFHSSRVFNRHKNLLKRHVNVDDAVNKVHHSSKRSEKVEESENEGWQRKAHENKIIFKQYSVQGNTGSPYPNTTTHRISVVPLGKPTDTSESNTVEPHNRKPPTNPEETPSSTENPPVPGTEGKTDRHVYILCSMMISWDIKGYFLFLQNLGLVQFIVAYSMQLGPVFNCNKLCPNFTENVF